MDDEKRVKAEIVDDEPSFRKIAGDDADDSKPRRRTYKKRRPAKAPEIPVKSEPLIRILFNEIFAPRVGEKWKLSPAEIKALSDATDPVMLKYTGAFFAQYSEEITLAGTVIAIIVPRFLMGESKGTAQPVYDPGTTNNEK